MTRETKDRARPFSRKHRKYWLPVTGGMILIGVFNVCLGMCTYDPPPDVHTQIQLVLPRSTMGPQAELPPDAGIAPINPIDPSRVR